MSKRSGLVRDKPRTGRYAHNPSTWCTRPAHRAGTRRDPSPLRRWLGSLQVGLGLSAQGRLAHHEVNGKRTRGRNAETEVRDLLCYLFRYRSEPHARHDSLSRRGAPTR
jgi:hypothetical protein